jgi:regulatory protein
LDDEEKILKETRKMVLRLLTYRARTVKEICEYLERKGFTGPVIESTINEMKEYGYLNDYKFASDYIAYRKNRGYGIKRIQYELTSRGIDKQIIVSKIEEEFNPDEDLARIKEILDKRVSVDQKINQKWLVRQALYLKRRGFQDNLIMKALNDYPANDYNYSE